MIYVWIKIYFLGQYSPDLRWKYHGIFITLWSSGFRSLIVRESCNEPWVLTISNQVYFNQLFSIRTSLAHLPLWRNVFKSNRSLMSTWLENLANLFYLYPETTIEKFFASSSEKDVKWFPITRILTQNLNAACWRNEIRESSIIVIKYKGRSWLLKYHLYDLIYSNNNFSIYVQITKATIVLLKAK